MKYPPSLSEEQLDALITDIKDWQLTHGSILKLVNSDVGHSVLASPIGVSLFPTPFPRDLFYEAISLQEVYNKLYQAVSEDEEWLYATIKTLFEYNLLARVLWDIHIEVKKEGYCQALKLDIYRSDYMLHVPPSELSDGVPQLKQVEFNTASCAGGIHANNISDMHRQLVQTGAYETQSPTGVDDTIELTATILPPNRSLKAIASGLSRAHRAYGTPKCSAALKTCVLFIVQSRNFNIADERPLEYALWEETPSIPTFRLCFGDVLEHTSLTSSRELLYHPPSRPRSSPMEVSVVYMRAGYDESEYDNVGKMVRLRLERSRAIKCPTILSHLTTFKKVQQALATPGTLERFLSAEEAARVERTFVPIYPMDELSDAGRHARKLAVDPTAVTKYILKPSLEGGGHNVYGDDIPGFLAQLPNELWASYILMERIQAPMPYNALISPRGTYEGRVISELGVFGICLWRAAAEERVSEKSDAGPGIDHLSRRQHLQEASWSFKTKAADMDEMSVVKGYGCFDSPALVDSATFASCCQPEGEECSCIGAA